MRPRDIAYLAEYESDSQFRDGVCVVRGVQQDFYPEPCGLFHVDVLTPAPVAQNVLQLRGFREEGLGDGA